MILVVWSSSSFVSIDWFGREPSSRLRGVAEDRNEIQWGRVERLLLINTDIVFFSL